MANNADHLAKRAQAAARDPDCRAMIERAYWVETDPDVRDDIVAEVVDSYLGDLASSEPTMSHFWSLMLACGATP